MTVAPSGARRPGRPRADGHDARILEAAVALIDRGEPVSLARVVAESGVSRAAIYRRWPTLTRLVADALDQGRTVPAPANSPDLLGAILDAYTPPADAPFPDARFRWRVRLALSDRALATDYWESHVTKRREPIIALLREGVERGELRADLDLDACLDAINGVFYYQVVVRGLRLDDPETVARCHRAIRTIWRGMVTN